MVLLILVHHKTVKIVACFSGKIIIYTDFYGANGFTIMLQNSEDSSIVAVYSHLSSDFIVKKMIMY